MIDTSATWAEALKMVDDLGIGRKIDDTDRLVIAVSFSNLLLARDALRMELERLERQLALATKGTP
jgi:hypothetical protein